MVLMSTWCNFADRLAVKYTFQVNDGADIRTDLALFPLESAAEVPAGVNGGDANSGALGLNRGDGWPMGLWLCCGVAPGVVSFDAT